ncbi:hypothetical protein YASMINEVIRUS_666 [Yasminevirus sp. GU-2018]|uniref:Very-long-chain 3-oxoacyl-CoA synthase n=1 Tax=Yasminevirus sp. GU-2018 TaxID=2420051 RepID=A0A5K0U9V2_9VIRU|nr:hypothetical protein YASMINEVIRUS_666 [Yasminevirus sp. GU-2018]
MLAFLQTINQAVVSAYASFASYVNSDYFQTISTTYGMYGVGLILSFYMLFVYFAKTIMGSRDKIEVKLLSQVYNCVQIVSNVFIVKCCIDLMLGRPTLLESFLIGVPSDSNTIAIFWMYAFNKLVDLIDTIFIVLKKDFRRLSTLHVSHHFLITLNIFMYACVIPRTLFSATAIFVPFINSGVHVFMYSYYLLSSIFDSVKEHKLMITNIQMTQFVCVFIHACVCLAYDTTYYIFPLVECLWAMYMLYMFGKFYLSQLKRSRVDKMSKEE